MPSILGVTISSIVSDKIKKLEKDERFVVIEVLADKHKMILINNYLPTMMTGSEPNYIEHLDKLYAEPFS
jgi:hypothetical protein